MPPLPGDQKLLHAILDGTLDAVITMDRNGVVTGWNPQAEQTFGFSRQEAAGMLLTELIIPLPYREAHMIRAAAFPDFR